MRTKILGQTILGHAHLLTTTPIFIDSNCIATTRELLFDSQVVVADISSR